jgi:formylglycine-generating enzyme required for sulfatase activity
MTATLRTWQNRHTNPGVAYHIYVRDGGKWYLATNANDKPQVYFTWNDALAYKRWLAKKIGVTGYDIDIRAFNWR